MPASRVNRGFAIHDLCFGLASLAVAAALVIATAGAARTRAQLGAAQNQLRWIAGVTNNYAADFEDRLWGLNWEAGPLPHSDPGLPPTASSSLVATGIQALDLLRRRGGRMDIPVPFSWYAPAYYSHLVLLDYLDRDAPDTSFVSPGDRHRLNWTKDPQELFDKGFWLPYQEQPIPDNKRWPYSSSFQSPAALVTGPAGGPDALQQGSAHRSYFVPSGLVVRPAEMSAIAYPSQKALLHESATWYTGDTIRFYAHPAAQVNVLSADGAAALRATADANPGWSPANPTWALPTRFQYAPSLWEGPPPKPGESLVVGYYRFTRGGAAGRDFGGPEIDTGQP